MMNPIPKTRDTILHEIAHALTPGHNHDSVWRAKSIEIGCDGKRCYGSDVRAPRACGVCCNAYNGRRFTDRFELKWRKVEDAA
jgi:hypothetical protein